MRRNDFNSLLNALWFDLELFDLIFIPNKERNERIITIYITQARDWQSCRLYISSEIVLHSFTIGINRTITTNVWQKWNIIKIIHFESLKKSGTAAAAAASMASNFVLAARGMPLLLHGVCLYLLRSWYIMHTFILYTVFFAILIIRFVYHRHRRCCVLRNFAKTNISEILRNISLFVCYLSISIACFILAI